MLKLKGICVSTMVAYFDCSFFVSQSSNTVETRSTSLTIPLVQIPFVMRAIGYYPSEQEVQ